MSRAPTVAPRRRRADPQRRASPSSRAVDSDASSRRTRRQRRCCSTYAGAPCRRPSHAARARRARCGRGVVPA
eukprot:3523826-Prymnesium_polylepis.1